MPEENEVVNNWATKPIIVCMDCIHWRISMPMHYFKAILRPFVAKLFRMLIVQGWPDANHNAVVCCAILRTFFYRPQLKTEDLQRLSSNIFICFILHCLFAHESANRGLLCKITQNIFKYHGPGTISQNTEKNWKKRFTLIN